MNPVFHLSHRPIIMPHLKRGGLYATAHEFKLFLPSLVSVLFFSLIGLICIHVPPPGEGPEQKQQLLIFITVYCLVKAERSFCSVQRAGNSSALDLFTFDQVQIQIHNFTSNQTCRASHLPEFSLNST